MQLLPHTPLDNSIINHLLLNGEQEVDDLYQDFIAQGQKVTLQAIYKRLRRLTNDKIILKNKKSIVINNEWREAIINRLQNKNTEAKLKNGESVIYSFKELGSLDAYWKHIMLPLEDNTNNYPVFFYNPYEIWIEIPNRKASEIDYLNKFKREQHYCFYLLGKTNKFSNNFKQQYQSDYLQISVGAEGFSERDYIAIINDHIITTKLSPAIVKTINALYKGNDEKVLAEKISKIFAKSAAIKLKIERNENKAKKLRKKIAKDFYIPKELKEKYQLF